MSRVSVSPGPFPAQPFRPPTDLLLAREAEATTVVSGPWSLSLRGAELDDISYDGVLVLRSIRLIARDEDWGTLPMHLDSTGDPDDIRSGLTVRGRAGAGDGVCAWTLTARVDGDGLLVTARVEATARFRRNRLGLIVLHPPMLAGRPIRVGHPDGSETSTLFPERISPHQPALDIAALSWQAGPMAGEGPQVDSVLRFSGDVFEMEDQRNWTDASFKTYSTPLSLPFPVELEPGAVVEQTVELRCASVDDARSATTQRGRQAHARVTFGRPDAAVRLPILTTSVSSGPVAGPPIPDTFGPLLCELDPATPNWSAVLDRAAVESGRQALDLRLIVGNPDEIDPVLDRLRDSGVATATIGVFDRNTHVSEPVLLAELRRRVDDRGIPAELLGGTRAHFTELNRNSERLEGWSGPVTFSITPFMHDRGGNQLVESLAMQRLVASEAVVIAGGRPVHVGPITLGARFNAVATSPPRLPRATTLGEGFGAELVAGATDVRQEAPSLGAWALGSVAALAIDGVASLSYFEASGRRGLRDADRIETDAADVLGWIAELSGGAVAPLESDHPAVVGLAVSTPHDGDRGSVGIVGNLGDSALTVEIDGVDIFTLAPGAVRRVTVRAVPHS